MLKIRALSRARTTRGVVAIAATGALVVTGLGLGAASANADPTTTVILSPQIGTETSAGYPASPFFYGQNSATPTTVLPVTGGDLQVPGGVQLLHQFPNLPTTGAGLIAAESPTALSDFVTAGASFHIDGTGTASFQLPLIFGPAGTFTTLRTDNDYAGDVGTSTQGWTSSHDIGTSTDAFYLAKNTSASLATIESDIDAAGGGQTLLAYGLQVTSAVSSASVASLQDGTNKYTFQQDITVPPATSSQTVFVPDFGKEHNGYPTTPWFYGDKGASNVPTGSVDANGVLTISSGTQVLHQFPNLGTTPASFTTGALRNFFTAGASWTGGPTGTTSFQLPFYYMSADNVPHFDTLYSGNDLGTGLHNIGLGDDWRSSHALPAIGGGTTQEDTLEHLIADVEAAGSRQELLAFGFEGTVGSPATVSGIQAGGVSYTFYDKVAFPNAADTIAATIDVGGIGQETDAGYPAGRPWFFGQKKVIQGTATLVPGTTSAVLGGGTQLLHQFSTSTEPASLRAFIESGLNFTTTDGNASFQIPLTYGPTGAFTTIHTRDDLPAGDYNIEFGDYWVSTHAIPATATTPAIAANDQNTTLLQIVNAMEAQGGTQTLLAFGVEPSDAVPTTVASIQAAGVKYTFSDNPNLTFAGLTITGTAMVGSTLTAVPNIVNPNGVSYAYQWYYNGNHKITSNGTGSTYVIPTTLYGKSINVRVVATKPGHVSASTASDMTAAAVKGAFASSTVTVSGTVAVGKTLTAALTSTPAPSKVTYQWYRGSAAIKGATKSAYTLKSNDLQTNIHVKVTGSRTGYTTLATNSTPSLVGFGTLVLGTPKLSGVVKVGKTVTVTPGKSTAGVTLQYWFSPDNNPFDAVQVGTHRAFKIPASFSGDHITVFTSGTKTGYAFGFSTGLTTTSIVAP
jgi:hypothetical protein